MSNGVTLSIMGLYNHDETVLDLMQFPANFTDAQKTNIKQNILIECSEFEFLYANPTVAKTIIGIWSAKEKPYWQRVYDASLIDYDPIENYRRNETETVEDGRTEQHTGNDVNKSTGSDSMARTGTDTNTASGSDSNSGTSSSTDTESGTDTTTNKITGFDSDTLVNHDSSSTQYGHSNANSAQGTNTQTYGRVDTQQHNTTDTQTYGKTDTLTHGEKIEHAGTTERSVLAYGNIGVTTSQQMLTQEMEIAKLLRVEPIIIESFKNRFCLMVY